MKLRPITRTAILEAMERNGTRRDVMMRFRSQTVGRQPLVATDGRFTIIVSGEDVGVAKRTTYAGRRDKDNPDVGLAIAATRLWDQCGA